MVSQEDLPAVRKAIEDFPEGALTLDLPQLDKIVVVAYERRNDLTAMVLGRELKEEFEKTGRMKLKLKGNQLQEVYYECERLALSGDKAEFWVRVNGHEYSFDGVMDLKGKRIAHL
jgi:hypothetical protein